MAEFQWMNSCYLGQHEWLSHFSLGKNVRDEASRLEKCLKERGKDNQSAIISPHKRKS